MNVVLLTEDQKNSLLGKQYAPGCYFNPIQDNSDNWIISTQEQNECVNESFFWVKDLPLIDYEPKPQTNLMHE